MDLQKIVSELVPKLTGNSDLIAKFTSNPLQIVKDLLGIDLDPSQIGDLVKGVQAALGNTASEAVKGGFLNKLKSFFGGK